MIVQIDRTEDTIDLAIVFANKTIACIRVCDAIESPGAQLAPVIIVDTDRTSRLFTVDSPAT